MSEREQKDQRSAPPDWLVAVLVIEATALVIALVTPLTPSKTGSRWTPADLFFADPSYLEKVLISFVAVNVIIAILGLVVWVVGWLDRRE